MKRFGECFRQVIVAALRASAERLGKKKTPHRKRQGVSHTRARRRGRANKNVDATASRATQFHLPRHDRVEYVH